MDPKSVLLLSGTVLLLALYARFRRRVGQEMIVALLFALFITSYFEYSYTDTNIYIGQINLFPLMLWTLGLVILREVYERLRGPRKLITASVIYWGVLCFVEFIGYYVLGIHLQGGYASLLGLGIIHGPIVIKIFYLCAGPVYLAVTDYLRVK